MSITLSVKRLWCRMFGHRWIEMGYEHKTSSGFCYDWTEHRHRCERCGDEKNVRHGPNGPI